MGVNLDLIKQKLESFSGKNKNSNHFWKPTDGTQTIRLVPYKFNLENPFIELKFYYFDFPNNVKKTYLSPSVVGDADPVLEFCEKLRATGTKENWILSKKYEPKLRTYAPVIVRGEEEKGVRFWGFGKTVYEELVRKMSNPDYGDITDLEEGHDIIVEFIKNPPSGKTFPETKMEFRIKKTPAVDPSNASLVSMLTKQVDIMTLFTVPKYEVLKQDFDAWITPEDENADPQPGPEDTLAANPTPVSSETVVSPPERPASPSAEKAASNVTDAVDAQAAMKAKFKKLFAEQPAQ